MELLDHRTYYRGLQSRDARFDGRVFVSCTSTGIYCRPICPTRPPKFENCRFFATAAAAQEAGFRPCLRCRPEIAPDIAFRRGTANTVNRALALIADGALDGEHSDVEALAGRLGVGGRQLRRLFQRHLGASPIAVAQTRRVLFAKQLLHDTRLPMTEVALASGFSSVRRFNDTFRNLFRRPPSALRRKGVDTSARDGVTLRLAYRPPYDWSGVLSALSLRAMPGTEWIDKDVWHRSIDLDGKRSSVAVAHFPERNSVLVTIRFPSVKALPTIVARARRLGERDGARRAGRYPVGMAAVACLCRATSQDGQSWLNPSPCWRDGAANDAATRRSATTTLPGRYSAIPDGPSA